MPPPPRRSASPRRAVVLGIVGVALGVGLLLAFSVLASRGNVDVRLGDDLYEAGRVDSLADAVERDGPVLVADASPNRERDIYLQHLGPDVDEGWLAYAAQAPGAERDCFLRWQPEEGEFEDPCSGERFPADGEGLTQYLTTVEDGGLTVDLNRGRASG